MQTQTFDENTIFYGPHNCEDCGKMIVRATKQAGGTKFDQPEGLIYPNTKWNLHNCPLFDPASYPLK